MPEAYSHVAHEAARETSFIYWSGSLHSLPIYRVGYAAARKPAPNFGDDSDSF
jgi:hypothetical protein